ncbi:hypothetical protein [Streptacidiphilus neutrinimicus]|nr:hypothetical protein [Streptacidiphilus neutrinimicus]
MSTSRRSRFGGVGCLLFALLVVGGVVALLVWAWQQPGADTPSYWH